MLMSASEQSVAGIIVTSICHSPLLLSEEALLVLFQNQGKLLHGLHPAELK